MYVLRRPVVKSGMYIAIYVHIAVVNADIICSEIHKWDLNQHGNMISCYIANVYCTSPVTVSVLYSEAILPVKLLCIHRYFPASSALRLVINK